MCFDNDLQNAILSSSTSAFRKKDSGKGSETIAAVIHPLIL